MALFETAFNFMMDNEDRPRAGTVTRDPSASNPNAVARFGINSGAHPEALSAGFYTMDKDAALAWAATFYLHEYWEPILGPQILSQVIANKYFDLAVNEGFQQSTKILQRAVNYVTTPPVLIVDGRMGPKTLACVNSSRPEVLLPMIKNYAIDFYKSWAMRTHQKDSTLEALLNRVNC